ncbi:hypothetical protein ANI02nite_30110 [Acetobacter nitrogenifigens DSM 23921 = NBRC 105050]|uniref:Uncharacterized protein n=1 Tax=Acetobacter nitrogenifigens DSM 23921 = NBRC 105050 TaxID=1120919 RepID=A0A511XDV1_9PROT|nr:hypothetical protein [Acetobacter nitrogenifigens]GEN61127.1 hypothetical protein ANI02nite_30110 [Acetobacter nitrogenifigens DSM 23921 = NBRC 105050]
MPSPRKFGARPRKLPYSIPRRDLDVCALAASFRVRPDLTKQVRTSGGMTCVDNSKMKSPRGFWYVG